MSFKRPARWTVIVMAASLPFAAFGISAPAQAQAQAQACHPPMQGVGTGKLQQPIAEPRARNDWRKKVGDKYGEKYDNWLKAKNHDMSCRHDGRRPALRQWTCVATATPCQ